MPYSEYAVTDRKSVSQLKYQMRRFKRQMAECGTDPADIERITIALDSALLEAGGSIDFHDDGSRFTADEYGSAGSVFTLEKINDDGLRMEAE